uniref:Uncharacterized protein n=1 Tax=Oryza sativa subsp. japonica TaxID=39947 RepID=Q339L8_ORYSJ|nr:hypothetical protein LOC_Os10g20460 [Oryza sativa Japonica Group]
MTSRDRMPHLLRAANGPIKAKIAWVQFRGLRYLRDGLRKQHSYVFNYYRVYKRTSGMTMVKETDNREMFARRESCGIHGGVRSSGGLARHL